MIGGNIQRLGHGGGEHAARLRIGCGQQEPRQAPCQRRLAHAARAGDQPSVMQFAAVEGVQKRGLGHALANQPRCVAGMRGAFDLVWGGGFVAHVGGLAGLGGDETPRRCCVQGLGSGPVDFAPQQSILWWTGYALNGEAIKNLRLSPISTTLHRKETSRQFSLNAHRVRQI